LLKLGRNLGCQRERNLFLVKVPFLASPLEMVKEIKETKAPNLFNPIKVKTIIINWPKRKAQLRPI